MRRFIFVGSIVVLTLALFGVVWLALKRPPQRAAPQLEIERTPERIARGRHLATHVAGCVQCHSEVDTSRFGLPVVAETEGTGGPCVGPEQDFDGRVCAPNLTPHPTAGVGAWTDGELLRAIREGVDRDGNGLFPRMPYEKFRDFLSDEDAYAIIAWMRSLPPSERITPSRKLPFPLAIVVKYLPAPVPEPVSPPRGTPEQRGRVIAELAGCPTCHTPIDERHYPIESQLLSGGRPYPLPGGAIVKSANLTPHPEGLGNATFEDFLQQLRDPGRVAGAAGPGHRTVMPRAAFAGMHDGELRDLWAWLRSVPPLPGPTPAPSSVR